MTRAKPQCCANCFGDQGLERLIAGLSSVAGTCTYCASENVIIIAPPRLIDLFGPLVNIYEPNEQGRLLIEWFRDDWDLFHHERMDNARAKDLLGEVFDNGDLFRQSFVPSPKYQSDRLVKWERLRAELMHENRYFPDTQLDRARFEELLELLKADDVPTRWFRARLQTEDAPYPIEKMGAPPNRTASHGRANPAGIPYLYLGSTEETAVAEIRPHTGEKACVAMFEIPAGITLVDLRSPRRIISPFAINDEDKLGPLRSDLAFLERLGEELTRPVVPQGALFDYVPSQYVCEFIKKCEYDGVLYRSAVSSGMNLALFKPDDARGLAVREFDVVRVSAEIRAIVRA